MDDLTSQYLPKFDKVIEVVRADLATIHAGKAAPKLIEQVPVEAYETKMPLISLGTISVVDAGTLIFTPFDKSNISGTTVAIQNANLGVTVIPEDDHTRVVVPPLSEERRQEYVKLAKTKVEGGKVMVRQVRHDAMEDIGHSNLDEDTQKRMEKELQMMTDKVVAELDLLAQNKESELLAI